ncbi:transcriptional regulator [Aureimonas flava]|uniref:Transcriptional regulator n=1 Tax=Aureimonas flava TaxID=2320271 RepID=A0A3A1WMG9_9HYPH|nr:helix-turn-helix domain-containing protein [Aureimonas flava]RIY02756.1 transcriptional regulator [Aureimonas flava]
MIRTERRASKEPAPDVAPREEPSAAPDPRVEALVNDLIGAVADKWTLLILEELDTGGTLRFTELSRRIGTISQKMLTQTLRAMERDGLVTRTVHPVVPPHVDYRLTELGTSLGAAFCGVWIWAERNLETVEAARQRFDRR